MLLDIVKKNSTDRSVSVRVVDSTDGTPETSVAYNTAGVDLWYRREGAAKTSITEATLSALTDAHSDGGFLHVGDGYCRLDLPDAAFATGANYVDVGGTFTGMIVLGGRVRLVNFDLEDAVRGGLTALPNAAAEAAGGLYTRGTGAGQINQAANGQVDANTTHLAGTAYATALAALVDAVHDEAVEGAYTLRQAMRLLFATLGGKADGLATTTVHYRNTGDTKNVVTGTVDSDGNRTAITLDLT